MRNKDQWTRIGSAAVSVHNFLHNPATLVHRPWCGAETAGALLAAPGYAEAHNNLGVLQRDVGAVPDALASYGRCLELSPDSRNAGEPHMLSLFVVTSATLQRDVGAVPNAACLLRPLP